MCNVCLCLLFKFTWYCHRDVMGLPELACTLFLGLHGTVAMVVKETPVMGLLNFLPAPLFEFARNRRHECDGAAKLSCA